MWLACIFCRSEHQSGVETYYLANTSRRPPPDRAAAAGGDFNWKRMRSPR